MGGIASAPPGPQPALATSLRALFDACPGCGWVTPQHPCPGCGGSPTVEDCAAGMGALLGRPVKMPNRWSGKDGIVVEVHPDVATVLSPAGSVQRVPAHRCRPLPGPPGRERVRSPAGALLAAAGPALPPAATQELHRRAWALAEASAPGGWRALAADCATLGRADLLAAIPMPEAERTWWTACAMWTEGRPAEAVAELLKAPAGRYPARLVLWWRAATGGFLPAQLRSAVGMAAREFDPATPAVTVAAALLLRALGERAGVASDEQLVAAMRTLGGDELAARLDGQQADSPAGRLLGALAGRVGTEELAADPALPAAAPLPVLDALVDQGRLPEAWLDPPPSAGYGDYLRARTAIDTLADPQLVEVGAQDERARRSIRRGDPLPTDLPPEVAARFASLVAALDGDQEAVLAVAGAAGLEDLGDLRTALADPARLPAGHLLADESIARRLLECSTVDPAGQPPEEIDHNQQGFVARLALRQAKSRLYAWDWAGARESAKTCLRFTADELQRDEAQNVIAAAQWQLGNDSAASAALEAALDGEYTAALQVNYAVVASELEPQQAAAHLSRLVLTAPDLPLRVSAARQAVRLWRTDQQWQPGNPLPGDLAGALRSLVVEAVAYDDFRDLVRLLATHDGEWLAAPTALDGSPHRATPAARIWAANARGPEDFIRELAEALRGSPEDWTEELRDQLLRDLVGQLTAPGDNQPWGYGVLVLEHRLPMPLTVRVALLALTVPWVCAGIDPRTAEPAGKFLDWLQQAAGEVAQQPDDQRAQLLGLLRPPATTLADTYLQTRRHQYEQVRKLYESVRGQIASIPDGARVDPESVRAAVQPGVDLCRETVVLVDKIVQLLTLVGLDRQAGPATALRGECEQLQQQLTQLRMSPARGTAVPGAPATARSYPGTSANPPSWSVASGPTSPTVAAVAQRMGMTLSEAMIFAELYPELAAAQARQRGLTPGIYDTASGDIATPTDPEWWRRAAERHRHGL